MIRRSEFAKVLGALLADQNLGRGLWHVDVFHESTCPILDRGNFCTCPEVELGHPRRES